MDIDALRSLVTVLAFLAFAGIVVWSCRGARRREFEAASRLPFTHEASESPAGDEPR